MGHMGHIEAQGRLYVSYGDKGWVILSQGVRYVCYVEIVDGSHDLYCGRV